MCWNLRGKSYCIENIEYKREEYLEKLKSFNLGSYESVQSFKKQFDEIIKSDVVHRPNFNVIASPYLNLKILSIASEE